MSFVLRLQVVMDSFRPPENRGWAFRGACLVFMSDFVARGYCFGLLCSSPPEFIPWQHASGSVGPLTRPLLLLLVKTGQEAPYQFSGRRTVVAPPARTELLIDATRGIRRTFNKEHRLAICYDRAGCDKSISL